MALWQDEVTARKIPAVRWTAVAWLVLALAIAKILVHLRPVMRTRMGPDRWFELPVRTRHRVPQEPKRQPPPLRCPNVIDFT
jgi:hypothetical protein